MSINNIFEICYGIPNYYGDYSVWHYVKTCYLTHIDGEIYTVYYN